jgi:hypothetical protein
MSKIAIHCSWSDVPHLSPQAVADMFKSLPVHQQDARSKGIPQLGSGAIYPVPESDFVFNPFEIPAHYRHAYALDVGWNRTAALWGAIDDQSDTVYFYAEHYRGQAEPSVHADAIKARGQSLLGVIDPAARGRAQKDGEQLFKIYQELGLHLSLADNGVESGIYKVYQRLSSGRIKIFSTCQNLLAELRLYRRDENGKVVKENDHLADCLRYFVNSAIPLATVTPAYRASVLGGRKGSHVSQYNVLDPDNVSSRNN